MTNYYLKENNVITQSADWKFDKNCLETQEEIIRYNGQLMLNSEYIALQQTPEYIAEQKKQKKNSAYKTYQQGLTQLKSEDELNQFLKSCGKITQSEYDSRLAIITTDLTALQSTYSTEVSDD